MKLQLHKTIVIGLLCFLSAASFAQRGAVNKAEKKFDRYSFIDARSIYLKVVEEGYVSSQIFKQLGDTYYYNSQYTDAEKWYTRLIEEFPNEVEDPAYYFKAAQASKSVGKYSKADSYMKMYADNGGDQNIVRMYNANPDYLSDIAEGALDLNISAVEINSGGSDFVSSFNKDDFVFASTANATGDRIYDWTQQGYLDLFTASIGENGELSGVTPIPGDVNTEYHESSTTFTKDGNTMYFTRNNFIDGKKSRGKGKLVGLKIYKASKNGTSWGSIEELPFNSDEYSCAHPALSVDEKRLYFSSNMPGSTGDQGNSDLWYVDINEDGSFGSPINLGVNVNTPYRESFPFVSKEGNLYFASDGHVGLGGYDVYVSELKDGVPQPVKNLGEPANSSLDDFGFIYDTERSFGYVSSNRDGGEGSVSDDIYLLKRCIVTIAGTVTNLTLGEALPNATVTLLDAKNNVIATTISDEEGRYAFENELDCGGVYSVRASTEGCETIEKNITTPDVSGVFEVIIGLPCDPCAPNDLGCRLKLEPIYFDFDRFNIRPDAEIELAKILAAMREYPQLVIAIESHTDSRGNDSYNEALSEKRAQSTLEWLVSKGIDRQRLSAKGYGEYQLTNQCSNGVQCTEEEHQLNRRSMFIIQN